MTGLYWDYICSTGNVKIGILNIWPTGGYVPLTKPADISTKYRLITVTTGFTFIKKMPRFQFILRKGYGTLLLKLFLCSSLVRLNHQEYASLPTDQYTFRTLEYSGEYLIRKEVFPLKTYFT